jgi:hypothetical protein
MAPPVTSTVFDDGGYAVMQRGDVKLLFRFPRFRFRPSHADALHVDLWCGGENLLRDGGSFGYNVGPEWQSYFTGTGGHNTVQFDNREQMPRLGRFLWADWLTAERVDTIAETAESSTIAASYVDRKGGRHRRSVILRDGGLTVSDDVSGFSQKAVLRWRLRPSAWRVDGPAVTDGRHRLSVSSDVTVARLELVAGWESGYYGCRTELPVVEVELSSPGRLTTTYDWSQ